MMMTATTITLTLGWLLLGIYALCMGVVLVYGAGLLFLAFRVWSVRKMASYEVPPLNEAESPLPFVTIQLPVYNERYVIETLLDHCAAFDYPISCFEIQVLDDSTDDCSEITAQKLASLAAQGLAVQHIQRENRTGFKAGALADAAHLIKGDFLAIFDADFQPRPDFLKRMLPYFANSDVGMVQTRWEHLNPNDSFLTRSQAFHLDSHFALEQLARCYSGYFLNFNGTAGIWRVEVIEAAGGWQPDTLTEDLDLSYRAQLLGWQLCYIDSVGAPAQLPTLMPAIKSQQFRWMKGGAEVARKLAAQIWQTPMPFARKWQAFQHLLGSGLFIFSLVSSLVSVPMLVIAQAHPHIFTNILSYSPLTLINFGFMAVFYVSAFSIREKSLAKAFLRFIKEFIPFIVLILGLSLHNAHAALQGFRGKKSAFVRTPKFALGSENLAQNSYRQLHISNIVWGEILLTVYFAGAVIWAAVIGNYLLIPFHLLLCLGYGLVAYLSLKHARN